MMVSYEKWHLDFGYEIFIAFVSVLSVFNMLLFIIPGIDPDAVEVVYTVNAFLTLVFIFDFGLRMSTTPDRSYYFIHDFGWADLLAIFPILRILRLFRVFKAYRLIHKFGLNTIIRYLSRHRADVALYLLICAGIVIIESGSFLVLLAESASPDANIRTADDAMWWTYVTITTVGYGDRYPVTEMGRLVGVLVMTTGVGVFATFAGYVANKLLSHSGQGEDPISSGDKTSTADLLAGLRSDIEDRDRKNAEINAKLERLGKLLAEDEGDLNKKRESMV